MQPNLLYFVFFICVVAYQQYCLYTTQQLLSTQVEELDLISKRLRIHFPHLFSDHPYPSHPSIYLAHNTFLHTKSPPPKASKRAAASEEVTRHFYGGKGDLAHLGGFIQRDNQTISENLWNFLLSQFAVKSIVDVGCGKGFSTSYFLNKGAKVLCIEGSKDAIANTVLPSNVIIEHDFSRGPWWPSETYDIAWSTEFLEHVGRQYMRNYMPVFAKSALVFVTASGWGGWHHVEVHNQKWWIGRFEAMGFVFSREITDWIRSQTRVDLSASSAQALFFGLMV